MKNLRNKIDEKDKEILNLFIKRLLIVLKILRLKEKNKLKIVDLKREKEVLKNILNKTYFKKFKPYSYLLFLNVFSISKILQYNELLEKTEKKQQNLLKKLNFKNFKIFYFKLPKEFLNLKIFLNCCFKKSKTIYSLFNSFNLKKSGFLMVKVNSLNEGLNFLTNRFNFYVNFVFKFKGEFYICFSNKLFLTKGFNLVCLTLTVNFNLKDFLNLNMFFMLKQVNILNLNFKIIDEKNVKVFFKLSCSFKNKDGYLKFFKILETNFKNLKILGVFKAIKLCWQNVSIIFKRM